MKYLKINILFVFALTVGLGAESFAQKSAIHHDIEKNFKEAVELYNKQKYATAKDLFDGVTESSKQHNYDVKSNAEYYAAMCAIKLHHSDADYRMEEFIEANGESPKINRAHFEMAKYDYDRKKYTSAADWFDKVDTYELKDDELGEYYFKAGYSYFTRENYKEAKARFSQITGVDNKYRSPAIYYTAHIDYTEGSYETALKGFQKLEKDENFAPIVPYYISQLYFLQGRYEEVISYASPLLESASEKRAPEIAKLIGESYFRTKKYKEAVPYLKRFEQSSYRMLTADYYQLGFAQYQSQMYREAIPNFEKSVSESDEMAQLAYYYIADCFLKTGNKQAARNSFRQASKLEFDENIQEDALFNYAKLAYELSFNPYNEAIQAFEEYIKAHPNSPRTDEAYHFLLSVYLTTSNFKSALESIEAIKDKDDKVKNTYQQVAYFRAVELYNDLSYEAAIIHFDKVIKNPRNQDLVTKSHYWKGEAYYKLEQWDASIASYNKYLYSPGVQNDKFYNTVNYNIGYAYFKQNKYDKASEAFRKFAAGKNTEPEQLGDAYLRIGDGYYILKDNQKAIDFYDKAVAVDAFDTDYAIFQVAMCYGLQGKYSSKVEALKELLRNFAKTRYQADAKYEIGDTYFTFLNNESEALKHFQMVLDDHSKSSYYKESLLKIALIKYNTGSEDEAFALFDKIIEEYPGSQAARESILKIEKIFVAKGQVDQWEEYVKTHKLTDVTKDQLDKANYEQAETKYKKGNYAEAREDFNKYLEKFPNGSFVLNANFYKAESAYYLKEYDKALEGYNYAIGRAKNTFTEKSLQRAADIHFNNKNYTEAKLMFTILEEVAEVQQNLFNSRVGLMRTNYLLNKFDEAIEYSQKLLGAEKVSQDVVAEAHLTIAKSALAQNKYGLALPEFIEVEKTMTNVMAAEAKFNIAHIQYMQENYEECQKHIFELIDKYASYKEWVTKSFLLLADNYLKLGDSYQAKITLQYVIDKSGQEQYQQIAQKKLDEILAKEVEKEMSKPKAGEVEINIQETPEGGQNMEDNGNE